MTNTQPSVMQTPAQILDTLWTSAGGDPSALDAVTLTGDEPQLPSSFRVAVAGQVSIAASALAASEIWRLRTGSAQAVGVDMRHAVVECRSERYLRVEGKPPPPAWDVIAGVYRTGDRRYVRLHTNFPHHRDAVCSVLACQLEREAVQAALMHWKGEAFETAAYAAESEAAGVEGSKELPAQMLDHATGYLMAFGAMMAKARQAREGGSWHVQVSLAGTGNWLWEMGRLVGGLDAEDLRPEAIAPYLEQMPSGFGTLKAVRPAAVLAHTPAHWSRPAVPLGNDPPAWPTR